MLFFFKLIEGAEVVDDEQGVELPDIAAARQFAIAAARDIIAADVLCGRLPLNDSIEVTDEAGSTLMTLQFAEAVSEPC